MMRYVAANIASDSSNGKHCFLVRSTRKPVVHLFCGLRVIWPGTVTEEGNSLGQNLVRVGPQYLERFVDELLQRHGARVGYLFRTHQFCLNIRRG
jgi:hypothetical protein